MKRRLVIILLLAAAAACVIFLLPDLCRQDAGDTREGIWEVLNEELPVIDCSTSARPLRNLIWAKLLDIKVQWVSDRDSYEKSSMFEKERHLMPMADYSHAYSAGFSNSSGTHGAYRAVIERKADLSLVARAPTFLEYELARESGVVLDVRPVAWDAFIFITSAKNPVNELSTEQVQKIFAGEITCWSEVGGPEKLNIFPATRNPQSGSQELFLTYVMGDRMISKSISPTPLSLSMMGPFSTIGMNPRVISFTVFYYRKEILPMQTVKSLAIDGIIPSTETIEDGTYPYVTPVYAVMRKGEESGGAAKLRDWLLTEEGRGIIMESGYVPAGVTGIKAQN